ncbi:MAG: hypothetical protein ACETWQ_06570 [Phycisphaerae bacterium]
MKKRMLLLVVALMVAGLWSSSALALDPMGPPMASLEQGKFSAGFDYAYGDMDIEADSSLLGVDVGSTTFKGVKTNRILANIGYGVSDDWEVYLRLGGANAEHEEFDGDYGFAYGFGTKVTFAKDNNLSWGALFQMGWTKTEDSPTVDLSDFGGPAAVSTDAEVDFYDIQIAVGPTYDMEGWRIYGGPMLHFLVGDVDYDVAGVNLLSADIKEESVFGGYVGAQFDIAENASCHIEYQLTGDASGIGVGVVWKF